MNRAESWRGVRIYTIGPSTRTLEELVALLRTFSVSLLADIRTIPRSRHKPPTGSKRATPHRLTPFATVRDKRVTYPGEDHAQFRLTTAAPFHLEATVRVLQRRPGNLVDVWETDRYRRMLRAGDELALVEVENRGTIDRPDLRWSVRQGIPSPSARVELGQMLRTVLGLDLDVEPARRLAESERRLRPTAVALRGMRPPRFPDFFEAFANVVPFQQLSLDAGVAIVSRLVERFGERLEHEGRRFYAFPKPQAIAGARIEALRTCGLSLAKAQSIRSLARLIESGELSAEKLAGMSTNDAFETLAELPGIGPWSAGLVLLRGLGRLDVFPSGDVGAERGLRTLLRVGARTSLKGIVNRFGDRRGYLYFCALGGNLLARGLIHAAPWRSYGDGGV